MQDNNFEDAAESVNGTPSNQSTPEKSKNGNNVGLGINGNGMVESPNSTIDKAEETSGDPPPKMSARLSRWVSDEPVFDQDRWATHSRQATAEKVPAIPAVREGDSSVQASPEVSPSRKTHSPQATAEGRPSLALELAGEGLSRSVTPELESAQDPETTPVQKSHSRQATAETAASLVAQQEAGISLVDMRSRLQSHSRQATAENVPSEHEFEASNPRLKRLSRQRLDPSPGLGAESAERGVSPSNSLPDRLSPGLNPTDRARSVSPARLPVRPQSPPSTSQGLSGEVNVTGPPPPSRPTLEQRAISDRPLPTSPPPQAGGLARTASTRIAGFLGRMGSMRKPGRSPPAPRQDRFAAERRNTAQSVASVTSNGGESLATISDGPEGSESAKGVRPSLQDQFQSLRRQEEFSLSGADGHAVDREDEETPIARTASDAGVTSPTSPVNESPESKWNRSASTPGYLKSPPLNPSLPPGTASGLTAGPAEEPRPVDWDLWQAVVNEGPAAVARTSGDELNRAIASGIPAAIRGVVWQVLAESKNADLEDVYRTLKARGTADAEEHSTLRPSPPSRPQSSNNANGGIEKVEEESEVSSSRASVHSEHSTPATSTFASQASPSPSVQGEDVELKSKLMAEKAKREAAALSKLEKAIKRDLGSRTSFSKYTQAAGLQDGLFGVCKAYALFDEGVGYAQGINFIAMPLLFNMTEEEAFTLLVRLMSKHDLRSLFTGDMAGLHLRLYQFERLLEDQDPALYCHLRRRDVGPQLYATQWFLTLFAYRFPLQLVLRVYDLFVSEGLTAILKFGLVLMQHNRDALLEMKDMGHLTNFLKEKLFDVYIDKSPSASSLLDSGFFGSVAGGAERELYRADEMVRDACDVKISEATLAAYTAEWEDSQRVSSEKDAELETLRTSNATLTTKVRILEGRTQAQDTEHVTLAGDLVRIKVENDSLLDENEGLKIKMEELQKMVDAQPAEVEKTLKEEMDRILQRNSEVQSENRVLKEEMEEMEQELVNVKMKCAQVSLFSVLCGMSKVV